MRMGIVVEVCLAWWVTAAALGADQNPEYVAALQRWGGRCLARQPLAPISPCPQELIFPQVAVNFDWRTFRSKPPFEHHRRIPGLTLYVDNVSGDDSFDGSSPAGAREERAGPVRTISRAVRVAGEGSRIVLVRTDRPYRESFTLGGGGQNNLVLQGNGAVIDGSLPIPVDAWEHFRDDVFRFRPRWMAHQQLFLDGIPLDRRRRTDNVPGFPKLAPLQWALFDGYIYFCVPHDKIPRDMALTYAVDTVGITIFAVEGVTVSNLIVQGFQLDGVNAPNNAFDCQLVNLICRGNGRSGTSVGGASRMTVDHCLLGNNGVVQLRTEGYSTTHATHCDFIEVTGPAWMREGGRLFIDEVEIKGMRPNPAVTLANKFKDRT